MKKGGSKTAAGEAVSKSESALVMRFWNCLKKSDVEGLEEILLRRVEDPETGAVRLEVNHSVAHKLVNSPNAKKILPLSFAVSQGMDEQGLHLLLRAGANVNAKDGAAEQATALHTACWGEDDIAAALLLRCGANPLITDAEGRTALHVLASLNAAVLFSYLLETATTEEVEQKGVLYLEGHPPMVVSANELLGQKDNAGFTVLHTALSDISSGSDRVVSELLDYLEVMAQKNPDKVKSLVNILTESGSSALHILLSSPNSDENIVIRTLERLLNLGASPIIIDVWGYTPLAVAIMTHSGTAVSKILRMLLVQITKEENLIRQLEKTFLQRDSKKEYALIHHAIARRNIEAVKVMVNFIKSLDEKSGSQFIKGWIGNVVEEDDMSVTEMVADGMNDEIADILITAHAIDEETYNRFKKERKEKEEKEQNQKTKKTKSTMNESKNSDDNNNEEEGEEEDDSSNRNNKVSGKNTGDFSGFGSATMTSGSRVQQARKARAHAAAQRRNSRETRGGAEGAQFHFNRNGIPLWTKIAIVFLIFLMIMRGLSVTSGDRRAV
ncbi:Ankyrin repeat-containing domain [Trypanosoma melophagium]|uniref:Ankyrin repeat-containing domain n=1 Tax=Trypanosoma melophagium TaxID=715481 RepID=UPI003519DAD6|nr:Ankyrin repeat-containing domain [Trypanosoma melophagium]